MEMGEESCTFLKVFKNDFCVNLQIVLPSKAIKNERILETLMFQANSGMYRVQDSYLEACQQKIQKQDSRFSESFDYGL